MHKQRLNYCWIFPQSRKRLTARTTKTFPQMKAKLVQAKVTNVWKAKTRLIFKTPRQTLGDFIAVGGQFLKTLGSSVVFCSKIPILFEDILMEQMFHLLECQRDLFHLRRAPLSKPDKFSCKARTRRLVSASSNSSYVSSTNSSGVNPLRVLDSKSLLNALAIEATSGQ